MLLVTKNLAELCTLVIDDMYGELPSRIFAALLNHGRAGLAQLAQHTSLTPRQLRHGLAVLLQYDLLFYQVPPGGTDGTTVYDANPQAAYNLLRAGKVLDTVEALHGADARDVAQSLLALGHTRIGDLRDAYEARLGRRAANGRAHANGHANGGTGDTGDAEDTGDTGDTHETQEKQAHKDGPIRSLDHLNDVLCRLVQADVVEVVGAGSFKSWADRQAEARDKVLRAHFPDGVRGKKKDEYEARVADELRALRDEARALKRTLQANGGGGRQKLRKLLNGDVSSGHEPRLDPAVVLRVNHDKCAVELRNQRLVQAAAAAVGETTAQVYAALLQQLTADAAPRCRADPHIDLPGTEFFRARSVATADVYNRLGPGLDVSAGIGKAAPTEIDLPTAERIEPHAPVDVLLPGLDDGGADDDDDMDADDHPYDSEGEAYAALAPPPAQTPTPSHTPTNNGADPPPNKSRVKFDDSVAAAAPAAPRPPTRAMRVQQMRQHLLLLCDHQQRFVRHCGHGAWTVDFEPLLRRLREAELDTAIERRVGRQGLRLARILRDKGKLDEKTLPALALMKKSDVQNTMLEMQMHGFVEIQEVPRDNNRSASRTLFLWFCDPPRALDALLDHAYKAMVRCLRIRDVHRQAHREVLAFVQRPDVKGREKEALDKKYFDKYQAYCDIEHKLLAQVMRLDTLVATLRDF